MKDKIQKKNIKVIYFSIIVLKYELIFSFTGRDRVCIEV